MTHFRKIFYVVEEIVQTGHNNLVHVRDFHFSIGLQAKRMTTTAAKRTAVAYLLPYLTVFAVKFEINFNSCFRMFFVSDQRNIAAKCIELSI